MPINRVSEFSKKLNSIARLYIDRVAKHGKANKVSIKTVLVVVPKD